MGDMGLSSFRQLTVGKLKKAIEDLPNNMQVRFMQTDSNFFDGVVLEDAKTVDTGQKEIFAIVGYPFEYLKWLDDF